MAGRASGRALVEAEVGFVLEFFLIDIIEPATGTTVAEVIVHPSIPARPTALTRVG